MGTTLLLEASAFPLVLFHLEIPQQQGCTTQIGMRTRILYVKKPRAVKNRLGRKTPLVGLLVLILNYTKFTKPFFLYDTVDFSIIQRRQYEQTEFAFIRVFCGSPFVQTCPTHTQAFIRLTFSGYPFLSLHSTNALLWCLYMLA